MNSQATPLGGKRAILLAITIMLAGRAMTLAYIGAAGSGIPGDPPAAWRMPLIGDALIGLGAIPIAYLVLRGRTTLAGFSILAWNILGIWDALSAFVVHTTNPWPEFFMIQTFGASMFFAASAMHALAIWLLLQPGTRDRYFSQAWLGKKHR